MRLYLYMTQVDLEGSPRRLFLLTHDMNLKYMLTVHVDDPIIY